MFFNSKIEYSCAEIRCFTNVCATMASQPLHSTPVKNAEAGNDSFSESFQPSINQTSGTSSGLMSIGELELSTMEKQRKELQLLIVELKDRDQELNDMVTAHQQQLAAWERDRQRALCLARKNEKFEIELKKRTEQIRLLIQRIKVSETKHKSKDCALETAHARMKQLEKNASVSNYELQDLKDKNSSLSTSLSELSSNINAIEGREQEISRALRLKEKEHRDMADHIATLSSKLKSLETEQQDGQRTENRLRSDLQDERSRYKQARAEMDHLKGQLLEKTTEMLSFKREISKLKEEIHRFQKEAFLKDDELRRKNELIELQRSKQDRTDKELASLRLIYERQQQELSSLQDSLRSSQDVIAKQEEHLHNISSSDTKLWKKNVRFQVERAVKSETSVSKSMRRSDSDAKGTDSTDTKSGVSPLMESSGQEMSTVARFKDAKVGPSCCSDVGRFIKLKESALSDTDGQISNVTATISNSYAQSNTTKPTVEFPSINSLLNACCSSNGFDLNDFEDSGSDTTNDILEEARRSAFSEVIIPTDLEESELPKQRLSYSSPTSKLQKLLEESREMVHNLERATTAPVSRPKSAGSS